MNNENKTTSTGKWSVALAIIPAGGVLLFLLPILLGEHSGEAGLAALCAMGAILYVGSHVAVVSGLVGAALGVFAIRKTQWMQGTVGLLLNLSILIISVAALTAFYHSKYSDPDQLNIAAYHGEMEKVEKLLEKGFDINNKYHDGCTPLHMALGRYELMKLLIAKGANVNAKDRKGKTPLHYAALLGSNQAPVIPAKGQSKCTSREKIYEIIDLLLENGAMIDAKDNGQSTALHVAVKANNTLVIEKLLNEGAKTEAKTKNGKPP